MNLGVERGVALLGGARAKTFDHRRIERDVASIEDVVYVVPTLQSGQGVQLPEQQLIVLQRAFDWESRED